jgi:hypothetical protein
VLDSLIVFFRLWLPRRIRYSRALRARSSHTRGYHAGCGWSNRGAVVPRNGDGLVVLGPMSPHPDNVGRLPGGGLDRGFDYDDPWSPAGGTRCKEPLDRPISDRAASRNAQGEDLPIWSMDSVFRPVHAGASLADIHRDRHHSACRISPLFCWSMAPQRFSACRCGSPWDISAPNTAPCWHGGSGTERPRRLFCSLGLSCSLSYTSTSDGDMLLTSALSEGRPIALFSYHWQASGLFREFSDLWISRIEILAYIGPRNERKRRFQRPDSQPLKDAK